MTRANLSCFIGVPPSLAPPSCGRRTLSQTAPDRTAPRPFRCVEAPRNMPRSCTRWPASFEHRLARPEAVAVAGVRLEVQATDLEACGVEAFGQAFDRVDAHVVRLPEQAGACLGRRRAGVLEDRPLSERRLDQGGRPGAKDPEELADRGAIVVDVLEDVVADGEVERFIVDRQGAEI